VLVDLAGNEPGIIPSGTTPDPTFIYERTSSQAVEALCESSLDGGEVGIFGCDVIYALMDILISLKVLKLVNVSNVPKREAGL
jgi:hypothetical protein